MPDRPKTVRLGKHTTSTLTLNTRVPQRCMMSFLLCTLFTRDYQATHPTNAITKFVDDTTVNALISNNGKTAYRDKVQNLMAWCCTNNLITEQQ